MFPATHTILVVDPDPHARALVSRQIQTLGCTTLEAADGREALRMLGERDVTLVVTELYLPAGEDDCLIRAVRRDGANAKTRIAALTHRSLAADRDWAMRCGADAYLIKPTRARRVRYVVSRLAGARPPGASAPGAAGTVVTERPKSPYRK